MKKKLIVILKSSMTTNLKEELNEIIRNIEKNYSSITGVPTSCYKMYDSGLRKAVSIIEEKINSLNKE